jgi:trans-aconitate methyltransferase
MSRFVLFLHYRRFHDDSEKHAEDIAAWIGQMLAEQVPAERNAPIVDIGCGYGFAL